MNEFIKKHFTLLITIAFFLIFLVGVKMYNDNISERFTNEGIERQQLKRALLETNETDHIFGSRDATVKLVLYSDNDCQYCRSLYPKLKKAVKAYPGHVALVYRHLPIYYFRGTIDDSEYASECVFREKGDDGFFAYLDALFERLPEGIQTENVDKQIIFESAREAGVSQEIIEDCIEKEYAKASIMNQHDSGGVLGVIVIPHTFMVSDKYIYELPRDQSEEVVNKSVGLLLSESI